MAVKHEKIALFIDFENLETGVRKQFDHRADVGAVINALNDMGTTCIRKAYADWVQHGNYRQPLMQCGVELIERTNISPGRNGSDVKLSVDAVEAALLQKSIDTFAIVSGNSDFIPLIQKLREYGKNIVVIGVEACTSNLVKTACDKYVSYESLGASGGKPAPANAVAQNGGTKNRIPPEVLKAIVAILNKKPGLKLDAGGTKAHLLKSYPDFDEANYGFSSFNDMLDFVQKKRLIPIKTEFKGNVLMIALQGDEKPATKATKATKENKEEQWEDRPMTEEEWEAFLEAVETCIQEGAGKANQGKLWIINAYLHRKRVDGILPLANQVLFNALQALTEYGALHRTENDCYLLTEEYELKKEEFLDELFGVEIDEEFYTEDEAAPEAEPEESVEDRPAGDTPAEEGQTPEDA